MSDIEEIAGSKVGNLPEEARLMMDTQKALLTCKTPVDVELVFKTFEEKVGQGTSMVDRIGALMSTVLMTEAGVEAYNSMVDWFLAYAKVNRDEKA